MVVTEVATQFLDRFVTQFLDMYIFIIVSAKYFYIVSAKFSTHLYFILQFFKFLFVATAGKAADSKAPLTGTLEDAADSPPGHDKSAGTWPSEVLKLDGHSPLGLI